MRPLRLLSVVLLALFAATSVFYAWQQHRSLAEARAASAALDRERTSLRKQLWEAQRQRAELEAQLRNRSAAAAGQPREGGPGGPDDLPPDALLRGPGEGGPMGRLLDLMNNPDAQRLASIQQRGVLDARYAALFKKLNLSPQQLEQFKNLLVEKRAAVADTLAAAREQGMTGRENRDEIRALLQNAQDEVDASIRATIGEAAFASYEAFEQTQPQRATVERLEQRLSYSATPLTGDQSEQLVEILAATSGETSGNTPRGARNAAARLGLPAGGGGGAPITDATVQRAASVLDPAQLQALQQVQQEQQAQAQLGQIVREQLRARSGGAAGTPTPPTPPKG